MDTNFLFILVVGISFLATFVSSMSGGGSSMITIPLYLSLGIPFPTANAVHQSSSFFWVLPASRNYLKGRTMNWQFLATYASIGLFGAYIGATLVASINEEFFKPIIGIIIFGLVISMAFRKEAGIVDKQHEPGKFKKYLFYITAPFLGFYESVFGSGNGVIFSTLAIKFRGNDLIKALGYYYFISFFWVGLTAVILIRDGHFNLQLMIATIIGSVLGGHFGSKLGRLKGNLFIKYAFIIVGGILGLKLILGL